MVLQATRSCPESPSHPPLVSTCFPTIQLCTPLQPLFCALFSFTGGDQALSERNFREACRGCHMQLTQRMRTPGVPSDSEKDKSHRERKRKALRRFVRGMGLLSEPLRGLFGAYTAQGFKLVKEYEIPLESL